MKKIKLGFQLVKESIKYAKCVKGFYVFPIVSAFCMIISIVGFGAISFFYAGGDSDLVLSLPSEDFDLWLNNFDSSNLLNFHFFNLLLFTFVTLFLSTFFNVALLGTIRSHFESKTSSFQQGINFALSKIKSIFMWTCVSFFIGNLIAYIFRPLTERIPAVSMILQSLVGIAWGTATYFVLPVIVFGSHSTIKEIIKESTTLMKEKLPEQISARLYISALYVTVGIGGVNFFL